MTKDETSALIVMEATIRSFEVQAALALADIFAMRRRLNGCSVYEEAVTLVDMENALKEVRAMLKSQRDTR